MEVKYYVAYKVRGWADFEDINFEEPFEKMEEASLKAKDMCFDDDSSAVYAKIGNSFFLTNGDLCGEQFAWVCKTTVENNIIVDRRARLIKVIENPEKFDILKVN